MRNLTARAICTLSDRYWQLTFAILALITLWYCIAPRFYHGPTNKVEAVFVAVLAIMIGGFTAFGLIFGKRMKAVIFADQSPVLALAIIAIAASWAIRFG